jgi:hypothetical protein
VFRDTVELTAQVSAFFLTFVQISLDSLISSEHRIGAFSKYNIFPGLPLMGGVYIRLVFWYGWFVLFEPRELLELLRGYFL